MPSSRQFELLSIVLALIVGIILSCLGLIVLERDGVIAEVSDCFVNTTSIEDNQFIIIYDVVNSNRQLQIEHQITCEPEMCQRLNLMNPIGLLKDCQYLPHSNRIRFNFYEPVAFIVVSIFGVSIILVAVIAFVVVLATAKNKNYTG